MHSYMRICINKYIYMYTRLFYQRSRCAFQSMCTILFLFFVSLDMPLCVFLLMPSFFMFQTERMSRRQCDRERNHQEWGCGKQEWRLLVMTNLSIYSHWVYHKNLSMYVFWDCIVFRCLSRCHIGFRLQISRRSRY